MDKMAKMISWCVIIVSVIALLIMPFVFSTAFGSQIKSAFESSTTLVLPKLSNSSHMYMPPKIGSSRFDQSKWTYNNIIAETNCMALNIYFEARNQDNRGQLAVGLVTINRVLSSHYPDSICDVVWEKRDTKEGKTVAQFSWTLDINKNVNLNTKAWNKSLRIAEMLLAGATLFNIADFTNGADHYHANYVNPFWSDSLTHTITIGDHLFYAKTPVVKLAENKLY